MSAIIPATPASSPAVSSQGGAGTVEFAITVLPFLFLGLGSIELAHWFYTRQAVSLALLDAGRAAITHHNQAEPIIAAFESALRPLYASSTDQATTQRLKHALADRQQDMMAAPWQIEVLSPSASAFTDFSDPDLQIDGTSGQPAINNNYLAEQDARYRASGQHDGRGPVSGHTIYEANTAVLRLSWLHQPRLPLMAPVLRLLGDPQGTYGQRALARGYLPIKRQMTLMMQSHPVQWSDSVDGKVIYGREIAVTTQDCPAWLCGTSGPVRPDTRLPISELDDHGITPQPDATSGPPSDTQGNIGTDQADVDAHPELIVDRNDPACGVTLCCTPLEQTPVLKP